MRTSALFGAKYYKFFKIYSMSARTRREGYSASADILRTRKVFRTKMFLKFLKSRHFPNIGVSLQEKKSFHCSL